MMLDGWLVDGIDLITVQPSENATDLSTFEDDLKSLLIHLRTKCPEAQIIEVDDFRNDEKHRLKENVCHALEIDFVDLSDIRSDESYRAGMGTIVKDVDGADHIIEHTGVARHPGDKGMALIVERIFEKVT